jgi:hypothetical protein
VSSLPPPAPPPPAPPAPPHRTASTSAPEWDWERARDLAERWYQPLLHSEGWLALAYLFLGMLTGIAFFVVVNVVGWTTFGLLFIGVGFLLIGVFFRIVDALAGVERRLASIVDVDIPARPVKPIKGIGLRAALDVERWRQLAFLLLNLPLAIVLFSIGSFAYSLVVRLVAFDFGDGLFSFNPFVGIVGWGFPQWRSGLRRDSLSCSLG